MIRGGYEQRLGVTSLVVIATAQVRGEKAW